VPGLAIAIAAAAVSLLIVALWLVAARAASRPMPPRPAARDGLYGGGGVHPLGHEGAGPEPMTPRPAPRAD
jgi:Spy/CpxP family protein refolding chaperone